MALANVAVHLARRGRRVLLVDFDLEAPGLDTFPALRPEEALRGLVDYVAEYLETDQAPDVRDFVGKSPAFDNMLVMPSGAMARGYAASFGQIDWGALYAEREGYLFFEDLKAQWREAFSPDYVLVDSRTGFTDTVGICTRQLPEAVTVLFFPNAQNLRGLAKVVADVRSEAEPPREKSIKLQFVMSNVPDLDDEDDILIGMKERFQRELGFDDEPLVVHRYDSLSLLNQTVFALHRPRSRLAREYARLADMIVRRNLADPDGAKQFIRERWRLGRFRDERGESGSSLAKEIGRIAALHGNDGEVLFRLGELAERRELQIAESLLDKAIDAGYRKPESYLERARARAKAGDEVRASDDALAVLDFDAVPDHVVKQAIRLFGGQAPVGIHEAPAIISLDPDDQIDLAESLARVGEGAISGAILRRLTEDDKRTAEERANAASQLALNCIGSRRFAEAIRLLGRAGRVIDEMGIQDAFNYGVAMWGESCEVVEKVPFERVLELHAMGRGPEPDAKYEQCLAVANWAAGHPKAAVEHARRACEEADSEAMIFSCWRYRVVRRDEFVADMEAILALIGGDENQMPTFLAASQTELPLMGAEKGGVGEDVDV